MCGFKLPHGDWPESLEDISFEHLGVDPIDMHTGEIFNYALIVGEPLLWSGGPDRDNDGGFAVESYMEQWPTEPYGEYSINPVRSWFTLDQWDAMSEEDQAKYDGDWILMRRAP